MVLILRLLDIGGRQLIIVKVTNINEYEYSHCLFDRYCCPPLLSFSWQRSLQFHFSSCCIRHIYCTKLLQHRINIGNTSDISQNFLSLHNILLQVNNIPQSNQSIPEIVLAHIKSKSATCS